MNLEQEIIKVLEEHGSLRIRKLEAHLVLRDVPGDTYDVQRALRSLEQSGHIHISMLKGTVELQ